MKAWVAYQERAALEGRPAGFESLAPRLRELDRYLWNTGFHWGDWLVPSITMGPAAGEIRAMERSALLTKDVIAPCFFARSTELAAKAAAVLGEAEDEGRYLELNARIREAFAATYLDGRGRFRVEFQGLYVLALRFGLVPGPLAAAAAARLVELVEENGWRLDTGFVSVPHLLDVLVAAGRKDAAYRLLFQTRCPAA